MTSISERLHPNGSNLYSRFYHPQREAHIVKVQPGGVYCTNKEEIICTGLGSCVAACMWEPNLKIGGMNHFLLPFDSHAELRHWHADEFLSTAARYGSHAMEMLINELVHLGADRRNLQIKLFGGAQMLGKHSMIGKKNIEFILHYVEQESFPIQAQDLGGLEPRKVMFDPLSGRAWIKRIPFGEANNLQHLEDKYASQIGRESHQKHDDDVELF